MLTNILSDIICQTYLEQVGKFNRDKALTVSFSVGIDYDTEEGYRQEELLVYGPSNYVQVWVRNRWNVIKLEDLEYDDDGDGSIKPGKSYSTGASDWVMIGDHDSCWRDAVRNFIDKHKNKLNSFSTSKWYEVVDVEDFLENVKAV